LIKREGVRLYVAYFDRNLSRRVRRVPLAYAVQSPMLSELEAACRALGYAYTSVDAKHSAVWWIDRGAVEVSGVSKKDALKSLGREIIKARITKEAGRT
jgi:signal recognition particle subunit SEC65